MSLVSWPPTSLRKSKRPQNQSPATQSMWTNEDDDSWEVRAFEEDTTGNLLGCTWPPRSYTCTFCRREFRSAQALGGHMNVHRRDRARLHEAPPPSHSPTAAQPILIQTEFVANGLCLVYPLPNPNSILFSNQPPVEYSSPIPPISSHSAATKPTDTAPSSVVSSICHSTNTEPSPSNSNDNKCSSQDLAIGEELDLELRLGRRQSQQTP